MDIKNPMLNYPHTSPRIPNHSQMLIGDTKVPLHQLKTKDNVDLVGLSVPSEVSKEDMPSLKVDLFLSLNNRSVLVTLKMEVATEEI